MNIYIVISLLILVIIVIGYYYKQASETVIQRDETIKTSEALFNFILKHISSYVLIIDENFIVEKTNYYSVSGTEDTGQPKRVGELINCVNSFQSGCGKGDLCKSCPIRHAISDAFLRGRSFSNLEALVNMRVEEAKSVRCNVTVSGTYIAPRFPHRSKMLITLHDITELKQAQLRLQDALDKTERIEKTKFTFLEKLGNEINDQLNCIIGWANLVSTDHNLSDERRNEYMNLIYEHSDYLSHMANDVLRLARIDAQNIDLHKTSFSLPEFCQDVLMSRMNNTHPNVEMYLDKDLPEILIYTDQQKLYHIIVNLLSNAQKFTDRGHIRLGYRIMEDNMLEFFVEDTGKGMPGSIQAYLFERFFKANTFTDGPGLGLAICKAYIEAMGGTIRFNSKEGRGTRFFFTIKREEIPANDVTLGM